MPNKAPLEPPQNTIEVDKRLRSIFLKNGLILAFIVLVTPLALIPIQWKLSHAFPVLFGYTTVGPHATTTPMALFPGTTADCTRIFTSVPAAVMDFASAGLIMFLFWAGITKINAMMLGYARSFAERKQWSDVAGVLESFNQSGQHLLDTTGEAHYLLVVALQRIGKPKSAQMARDYLMKRKSHTEWAKKLLSQEQATVVPVPSVRPKDAKPPRGKRRRF